MSTLNSQTQQVTPQHEQHVVSPQARVTQAAGLVAIQDTVKSVGDKLAPVWPLKDYVAVNPYAGLADHSFLSARKLLRSVSDLEVLMSPDYYRQQFEEGALCKEDIDAAVDELVADGVLGAERIDVNQVVAYLKLPTGPRPTADVEFAKQSDPNRSLRTFVEMLDYHDGSDWNRLIRDEISKHCATHYDQGQAAWSSPWQELPLYQAWRLAAQHDRNFEILGVSGFRGFVSKLPHQPFAALLVLLKELGVPRELRSDYLLCEALSLPGWSAWARYQQRQAEASGEECSDFAGLLAMRLAYEVALSKQLDFHVSWPSVAQRHHSRVGDNGPLKDEDLLRYALLKASEIAFRKRLVSELSSRSNETPEADAVDRSLAQMVFCIDVRSERIRRHIEETSSDIETFGFAGFFGLPIELVAFGESEGSAQVPVLLAPQFKVHEEIDGDAALDREAALARRSALRLVRKAWKDFQASAVSAFAFVETAGLFYGFALVARCLGVDLQRPTRFDGVKKDEQGRLAPSLRGLTQQGISTSKQVDLAESILRGIGIVDNFARLVVFCGHGSQSENNPLKAGLDCGACGGHTGEANARLAAKLLNQQYVRRALAERGIEVPDDTQFVAALHNTTTDELEFFDTCQVPASHHGDLAKLDSLAQAASAQTRSERLAVLPGRNIADLVRRSRDWSEVRPEWGLAGNAAFIVAPRELTAGISLDARAFLHSYDHRSDPSLAVLEQIMTAPMIVANWINMQYYASTVDPIHFGSGNKTVHNVVGRFGILSGNTGDLMTGLPWQSLHDGARYQHHPLRLLSVIAAPRKAIETIISRHQDVAALLSNGWMQLVAIEEGGYYRYTERQQWEELVSAPQPDRVEQ